MCLSPQGLLWSDCLLACLPVSEVLMNGERLTSHTVQHFEHKPLCHTSESAAGMDSQIWQQSNTATGCVKNGVEEEGRGQDNRHINVHLHHGYKVIGPTLSGSIVGNHNGCVMVLCFVFVRIHAQPLIPLLPWIPSSHACEPEVRLSF